MTITIVQYRHRIGSFNPNALVRKNIPVSSFRTVKINGSLVFIIVFFMLVSHLNTLPKPSELLVVVFLQHTFTNQKISEKMFLPHVLDGPTKV